MSDSDSIASQFKAGAQPSRTIAGDSGLPMIVMGRAYVVDSQHPVPAKTPETPTNPDAEKVRFTDAYEAIEKAYGERTAKAQHVAFELRSAVACILIAEQGYALSKREGQSIHSLTLKGIAEGLSAERAVYEAVEAVQDMMLVRIKQNRMPLKPEKVQEELADVLGDYLHTLKAGKPHSVNDMKAEQVLVTQSMNVGKLITFRSEQRTWDMAGMLNSEGSQLTHVAIVARGGGLLRVRISREELERIKDGDMLILDGTANKVIINPTSEQMDEYARFAEEQRQVYLQLMHRLEKTKREPLKTRDGQVIHVHANISTSDEVQPALMNGAESLALIRTELMAMINGGTLPEHIWEENFRHIMNEDLLAYVQFYPDMPPDKRPVPVFRTLDLTGDKKGDVSEPQEPKQIRALLKALKSNENFRGSILIPMVEDVFAFNALHAFMELEAKTLETKPVDFGAMLENATIIGPDMEQLRANYFSVGTNDLYTACAKQFDGENGYRELAPETAEAKEAASALRYDERLEKFKDQTHPFFLGKLKDAREIAAKLDKPICICGDMASDLRYRPLLLGLGYESTSVGPSAIPGVYEYDARLDSRECAALATKVMNTPDKASRDMLLVEFGERHGLHRNGTLDIDWQPPGQEHQPVPPGH